jgi:hypothetical protein
MQRILSAALLGAALLLAALSASAAPHTFVVYIARLGGDTGTAKPFVDKFAAHLEKVMGWKKGSCAGEFFADRQDALKFIKDKHPGFGLLEPPLYFELQKPDSLVLVAQIKSAELVSPKLHVVVKDPSKLGTLGALRGKILTTTLAASPRYLSKVVFDGKVDAEKHFKLKRVGTALKGVRMVLAGAADATLIDDEQLAAARKMQGGQVLRSIHESPELPPLPVAVFSKVMKADEQKSLEKKLPKICQGEGAQICKDMHLPGIQAKNAALFAPTQQRFDKP